MQNSLNDYLEEWKIKIILEDLVHSIMKKMP